MSERALAAVDALVAENKRLQKEIQRLEKRNAALEEKLVETKREHDIKEADDYYFNGGAVRP